MKAVPHIFGWLDQVKADRGLHASSDFKVAYQLSNRTNGAEFRKTGYLITWQAVPTLAAATGLSEPTVRRAARRLEANGHVSIRTGRGPGYSNRYVLILKDQRAAGTTKKCMFGGCQSHGALRSNARILRSGGYKQKSPWEWPS